MDPSSTYWHTKTGPGLQAPSEPVAPLSSSHPFFILTLSSSWASLPQLSFSCSPALSAVAPCFSWFSAFLVFCSPSSWPSLRAVTSVVLPLAALPLPADTSGGSLLIYSKNHLLNHKPLHHRLSPSLSIFLIYVYLCVPKYMYV